MQINFSAFNFGKSKINIINSLLFPGAWFPIFQEKWDHHNCLRYQADGQKPDNLINRYLN